jgi:hypothetical protein
LGQNESESGNALDTFVGGGDEKVDPEFGHVERHAPKGTHRIKQEDLVGSFYDSSHFGEWI